MQRKLHPLEGIVAVFALVFVLFITIGFAQAQEAKPHKAVYLRSSSALVLDADTGEIVIDKNADAVTPIASITKLMTAMVILDRNLDLDQRIVLSRQDIDSLKGTRSRLRPGNVQARARDRKSTRLNSSHLGISYAVFCLKKKKKNNTALVNTAYWMNTGTVQLILAPLHVNPSCSFQLRLPATRDR